jgi:hypothetical protein
MAVTDYGTCSYGWAADVWGAPSTSCGSATQTRRVYCQRSDGTEVPDAQCAGTGTRPDGTLASYQTSGCSFSWSAGSWSGLVPACGSTVENRSVTCTRSDGQPAADGQCDPATRPAAQRPGTSYQTCGYAWETGSWSTPSRTCGSATRTRTVTCGRSDGTTVDDAQCTGARPDADETVTDYSACSYRWTYTDWLVAQGCGATMDRRTASCVRQDGVQVDGGYCGGDVTADPVIRASTDYSACSFEWRTGSWSTPSACGMATRTRTVTCTRSDGTAASDAQCEAGSRPATSEQVADSSGCLYDWVQTSTGDWSTCVNGVQSRAVTAECRRSDGTVVSDALCPTSHPPVSETRGCGSPVMTPPSGQDPKAGEVIFRRAIEVSVPR